MVEVTAANGTIRMKPVLFCAPVFWTPKFWSESARAWDWVQPEMPVEEKPSAEVEVSLDVTLGEIFEAVCDAWGIQPGPELIEQGGTRAQQFTRFAFVLSDRDPRRIADEDRYEWPPTLPVAQENGVIEQVPGLQITVRELLASSSLGLIEGDVKRPYVDPVIPQGEFGHVVDAARITVDAIRAAYAEVDGAVGYADHTIRLIWASLPGIHQTADHVIDSRRGEDR